MLNKAFESGMKLFERSKILIVLEVQKLQTPSLKQRLVNRKSWQRDERIVNASCEK